eukprot:349715-Chlamydomonas_euryale.AAC.11
MKGKVEGSKTGERAGGEKWILGMRLTCAHQTAAAKGGISPFGPSHGVPSLAPCRLPLSLPLPALRV